MPNKNPRACTAFESQKVGKVRQRIGQTIGLAMLATAAVMLLKEDYAKSPVAGVVHGVALALVACAVLIFIRKNPRACRTCFFRR